MPIKLKILLFVFLLIPGFAYTAEPEQPLSADQDNLRPKVEFTAPKEKDPFVSVFELKKQSKIEEGQSADEQTIVLPSMSVQGVIWGGKTPCAIINNKVLREGESIEEARVLRIQKEAIELLYRGRKFTLSSPASAGSVNPHTN